MGQRKLVQVVRRDAIGITAYAWRPDTDTEGDPTSVTWTADPYAPPGYKAWEMNESSYGTKRSAGSGRWAVCPICQEEFPCSEMAFLNGRYYDYKNGCAQEVASES